MTGPEWKRLAELVISRRAELGMKTTKALAEAAGLTPRMVGDIENARRVNYSAGARAQIENALKWRPGSIDNILSGGEPQILIATLGTPVPTEVDRAPSILRLVQSAVELRTAVENDDGASDAVAEAAGRVYEAAVEQFVLHWGRDAIEEFTNAALSYLKGTRHELEVAQESGASGAEGEGEKNDDPLSRIAKAGPDIHQDKPVREGDDAATGVE